MLRPKVPRNSADTLLKLVEQCAGIILNAAGTAPRVAVVLGSGFQGLASELDAEGGLAFEELPGFPSLGVPGHGGKLLWGSIGPLRAFICCGRAHYYEGHSMDTVTWPVRVMAACGVEQVILTNAAGAINPMYRVGDFMLFSDHINFMGVNPLLGVVDADNRRFLDLSDSYSPHLRETIRRGGAGEGVDCHEGVYIGVSGPSYETPAEIRAFRTMGADAVGMSTIPEAIMARYFGMEVAAVSCITNAAAGLGGEHLSHDHVLTSAEAAGEKAARLFRGIAGAWAVGKEIGGGKAPSL